MKTYDALPLALSGQAVPPIGAVSAPLPLEIDRRRPISGSSSRGREKKKREKKREKNLESVDPSPAGDFFSLRGEKE
ncbi:hypothetical protein BHE74_00009086 [Ensete ventricosum]|nr:hypothetical protein GW17_00009175 [Ensete ventricosum]RWW82448.1 hypothetical protein BHE74_00009086 [Ensete ventricosum]